MRYYIITDTHLGDAAMHKHCDRPKGFENKILHGLRTNVRSGDVVICLGDVCRSDDARWNQELTDAIRYTGARAILVEGNHDCKSAAFYIQHGWDFVCDMFMMKRFGLEIIFSHKPAELHSPDQVNIHGHFHNTNHHPECPTDDRHMCLFMEHHYRPISLEYIADLFRTGRKFKG